MTTITRTYTQVEEDCCSCGITFTMPQWFFDRAREDNTVWFYCPQGHRQHYANSEVTKLREQLERAQTREKHLQDQREAAERHASAMKGQVTRLKNRAKAGVCPCCNRSFVQLERHMKSKHPDFEPSS